MSQGGIRSQLEMLEDRRLLTTLVDVDLDGDLDFVEASGWFENVDGYGNVESHPFSQVLGVLAVGDLDGDGDPDIATKDRWFENVDGDFETTHAFGPVEMLSPARIRLLDVGADGDLDIVFISDDQASLLENRGMGEFAATESIEVPRLEDVADLDNDGDLDAVTIKDGDVIVHVNGVDGFAETVWHQDPRPPEGPSEHPFYPTITDRAIFEDFDGDGWIDLVTNESRDGYGTARVHANNGAGQKLHSLFRAGCFDCSFLVADFDGDGDFDLVGQRVGLSQNELYSNDGNRPSRYLGLLGGDYGDGGDINGDGLVDMADQHGNWIDGRTNLAHVQGTVPDAPTPRTMVFTEETLSASLVRFGIHPTDIDGDGLPDPLGDLLIDHLSDFADMDGDGDTDFLFTDSGNGITWIENSGVLPFGMPPFGVPHVIDSTVSFDYLAVGDVTNDGFVDVVVASRGNYVRPGEIFIYENRVNRFHEVSIRGDQIDGMQLVDADGDGDLDIFTEMTDRVDGEPSNRFQWFENDRGSFVTGDARRFDDQVTSRSSRAFTDINGDGMLDLVRGDGNEVVWYDSVLGDRQAIDASLNLYEIEIADVDGDGDSDVLAGLGEAIYWYENLDGRGTFSSRVRFGQLREAKSIKVHDIDADGDLDITAIGRGGESIAFKRRLTGDANDDGVVNSADLVTVFRHAEYEDGVYRNSTFETGDWNGDREFDSRDLIFLFSANTYQSASQRKAIAAAIAADRLSEQDDDIDA